jgi:hypothetical protein
MTDLWKTTKQSSCQNEKLENGSQTDSWSVRGVGKSILGADVKISKKVANQKQFYNLK